MGHFTDLTPKQADAIRGEVAATPRPDPSTYRSDVVCCTFGRPAQPCRAFGHADRVMVRR